MISFRLKLRILVTLFAILMASTVLANSSDTLYRAGLEAIRNLRYGEAIADFRQASAQGHRDATRSLGLMLLFDKPLTPDKEKEAIALLRRAATHGCETSQIVLARLGIYHPD